VPNLLVVHPSVPAQSLKELIALFKANPGKYNYASNGNGTSSHLAAEMLKSSAVVSNLNPKYKGGAPAVTELLAGRLSMYFATMSTSQPHIAAGKLLPLAHQGLGLCGLVPQGGVFGTSVQLVQAS